MPQQETFQTQHPNQLNHNINKESLNRPRVEQNARVLEYLENSLKAYEPMVAGSNK